MRTTGSDSFRCDDDHELLKYGNVPCSWSVWGINDGSIGEKPIAFGGFVRARIPARGDLNSRRVVLNSAVMAVAGFSSAITAAFALQRTEGNEPHVAAMTVSAFGIITGSYHVAINFSERSSWTSWENNSDIISSPILRIQLWAHIALRRSRSRRGKNECGEIHSDASCPDCAELVE